MNRRTAARRVSTVAAALGATAALPLPAAAHALSETFQLPVPLGLYLAGAGIAVAASFAVTAVIAREPAADPGYPATPVPQPLSAALGVVLRVVGLVWWLGAIAAGLVLDDVSLLPAVLVWIGLWVGLPIVAVLVGNPWPSLSPFRTLFDLLERAAVALGADRLDLGLRYPSALGRWPAVGLLFAAVWCELVLPGRNQGSTIAALLIGYTLVTLLGMMTFGRVAWLRHAELFEVLLGWFGRVGPIGRRVTVGGVCEGCAEACDADRCVDCAECAAAAERTERRVELRPWFAGLTEVRRAGWSDAAFIVLALAGVSYDGLRETVVWAAILNPLFTPLASLVGPAATVDLIGTIGLAGVWLLFLAAFVVAVTLTRALGDPGSHAARILGASAGMYASTLLPIAGGYLIAHYLTLVIQGAQWLPALVLNPVSAVAPSVDWIPIAFVWYLSVGAIVVGHIAAIVLAHRIALRDARARPAVAGLPLVVLMVGYTVLSLWIIAQPIVIEPG